jgi:hypothetical protein
MSTAEIVRERVASAPSRGFIAAGELPGSRRAVECALSRLAADGGVVRVRKGLYWKGPKTRFGMATPRSADVALEVAGLGAGPAEVSAAHLLGLTAQVPSVAVVAVPGRVPVPVAGARFVSRSIERRIAGLWPVEVAVLEVLRGGPESIEKPWSELASTIERLAAVGEVRLDTLASSVADEHHVATRERWAELAASPTKRPVS